MGVGSATGRLQPRSLLTAWRTRHFASSVPTLGSEIRDSINTLANGDHGQQAPQAVPVPRLQLVSPVAVEETLVRRLDDVFRIDFVLEN